MRAFRRSKSKLSAWIVPAVAYGLGKVFSTRFLLEIERALSALGRKSVILLRAVQPGLPKDPLNSVPGGGDRDGIAVVIAVHSKDFGKLALACLGAIRHVRPKVAEIVVATDDVWGCEDAIAVLDKKDRALIQIVDEKVVLARSAAAELLSQFPPRVRGWVLQQILKFQLALECEIPVLILDSDTVLTRPRTFAFGGRIICMVGIDGHPPYFAHVRDYFRTDTLMEPLSFVTHHQVVDPSTLREMVSRFGSISRWVELSLKNSSTDSMLSEYQTFGSYCVKYWIGNVVLTRWANRNASGSEFAMLTKSPYEALTELENSSGLDDMSISFHSYLR